MKTYRCIIFVFVIFMAFPANLSAFYKIGDINHYLSYDRFKVITKWDDQSVDHPKLQGRIINKTREQISFMVNIYFCDVHNKRYNSATVSMSLKPNEKADFENLLNGSEYEYSRDAHQLEFRFVSLTVGGRNMLK